LEGKSQKDLKIWALTGHSVYIFTMTHQQQSFSFLS